MKPLIDADVLLYEIGFSSEKSEKFNGETIVSPSSWEFCQELFDKKIDLICDETKAKEKPRLYLTNTKKLNQNLNRRRSFVGEPPKEFIDNFRYKVAEEREYKAGRKLEKPFHFDNLVNYILSSYDACVNENGLEADDQMCIDQFSRYKEGQYDTIICSRDKDLRQCPGNHYSWECGKQASVGPLFVDELGMLEEKGKNKVFGTGYKFFCYQMLVGDNVDNIGGIQGRGPKFAFNLLKDADSIRGSYELVAEVYVKTYGDKWKHHFKEQANLLWMIREVDERGEKVLWKPPERNQIMTGSNMLPQIS